MMHQHKWRIEHLTMAKVQQFAGLASAKNSIHAQLCADRSDVQRAWQVFAADTSSSLLMASLEASDQPPAGPHSAFAGKMAQ